MGGKAQARLFESRALALENVASPGRERDLLVDVTQLAKKGK
jgi:hypothetical protein